jgi:autophagy-related protein 101
MSNKEIFELAQISVEEHQVREVLKCIVHTIIFSRALGHVAPRDVDLQLINVSYVEVADDDIERQVDESLKQVEIFLNQSAPRLPSASPSKSGVDAMPFTVRLAFYELVSKAGFSSTYQEKVYWEIWKIHLQIVHASQSGPERERRRKQLQDDVDNVRTIILHNADSKKDHIPPVKTGTPGSLTYPFEIVPERHTWLGESFLGRTLGRLFSGHTSGQPGVLS